MADTPQTYLPTLDHQRQLLAQLQELAQQQAVVQHALQVERDQLQRAVAEAVARLSAMVSGARASRAELQAIIDTLRAAQPDTGAETSVEQGSPDP